MSADAASLKRLGRIQSDIFASEELLTAQYAQQERITNQMLSYASELRCELRLISMIRSRIIRNKASSVQSIINSQALRGLSFSALEYCPSFFDSNLLNHYMSFIGFLRANTDVLAKCLYHYAVYHPEKVPEAGYSAFLTLFQQGWCVEEDVLIYQTLQQLVDYQAEKGSVSLLPRDDGASDKVLRIPRANTLWILKDIEPLASFVTAYLFNGACFAYLQSALANVMTNLYALSNLKNLRNTFTLHTPTNCLAPFEYWSVICQHAVDCFKSLLACIELLPVGVSEVFRVIRATPDGEKHCVLLFFESFVNRALDNTVMIGLLPWHPGHAEWSPAKDIASVFRCKYHEYIDCAPDPLAKVLSTITHFEELNFNVFFDALTAPRVNTVLISECELLNTNPNFPKELVITGKDLCLLHAMAKSLPENTVDNKRFNSIIARLGEVPPKKASASEHFRIVLQRHKEVTTAAKLMRKQSLFEESISDCVNDLSQRKDHFAEFFCDVLALLPSFDDFISTVHPPSLTSFFETLRMLTPIFLDEGQQSQTAAVLYYATHSLTDDNRDSMFQRITDAASLRSKRALVAADRTASLRSQHQRIFSQVEVVKSMRENFQAHLLLEIANTWIMDDISSEFCVAMSKCGDQTKGMSNIGQAAQEISALVANRAQSLLLSPLQVSQIVRLVFFRMMSPVTVKDFMMESKDKCMWKRSVIISDIIERHKGEMVSSISKENSEGFEMVKKYLETASGVFGHISPASGLAAAMFYTVETMCLLDTLRANVKGIKFDPCVLWVLITTKCKHVFGVGKFIQQFLFSCSSVNTLLTAKELQFLSVFCSATQMLCKECSGFDKRVENFWEDERSVL